MSNPNHIATPTRCTCHPLSSPSLARNISSRIGIASRSQQPPPSSNVSIIGHVKIGRPLSMQRLELLSSLIPAAIRGGNEEESWEGKVKEKAHALMIIHWLGPRRDESTKTWNLIGDQISFLPLSRGETLR